MCRLVVLLVALTACGDNGPSGRCTDGEVRDCYTGPLGSEGIGTCAPGIETCVNGAFNGICIGDVTPFVEQCDGEDEDCNGEVDDVDGSGGACTAEGCEGVMACVGESLGCVAPARNECDVCGGATIADVGVACAIDNCSGELVCNGAGDGTTCNAPAENACGLCGGPAIVGLGDDCTNDDAACPGLQVCNGDGVGVECSCNPQPGMCRDNGEFREVVAPQVGDLVITEIMQSPSGDDTKREWFEVEVKTNVDLNQLLLDRAGDSGAPDVVQSVDCIAVTAGTRLVFARSRDVLENGGLPAVAGEFSFALPSAGDIQLLVGSTVIDAVTWTSATNDTAMQLDPDFANAVDNDDQGRFCDATSQYNGVDFGTPGAANADCVFPGECRDGTGTIRPIVKPTTTLVITEFLANPDGNSDGSKEWFEIANVGPSSFDLNDLTFRTPASAGITMTSQTCIPVSAGSFVVFARSNVSADNAGLPQVDFTFSFGLTDSNSGLSVLDGATVIDEISWTSVTSGRALGLDPDHLNVTDNDTAAPTAGVNCLATSPYGDGTNQGTPGTVNPECP